MSNICSCIICKKEYSSKGIHTHYERNHGSDQVRSKYSSGNNGKYHLFTERSEIHKKECKEKYNLSKKRCIFCDTELAFDQRSNKFCNQSCSASYHNKKREETGYTVTSETKEKISLATTGLTYKTEKIITCCQCGDVFKKNYGPLKTLSNIKCDACYKAPKSKKLISRDLTKLNEYRQACKFKFGIGSFPAEFDFTLITEHGWYKAKNHGNNMRGVSRDHMVSVRYGFDNNIDPNVIAHPANCQLMQHHKNNRKYINNSVTYEELLERIKNWDLKYPIKL